MWNAGGSGQQMPRCARANSIAAAPSPGFRPRPELAALAAVCPSDPRTPRGFGRSDRRRRQGLREPFRQRHGRTHVRPLIDELPNASERFRELWARGDVGHWLGVIHARHPTVLFQGACRLVVTSPRASTRPRHSGPPRSSTSAQGRTFGQLASRGFTRRRALGAPRRSLSSPRPRPRRPV